MASNSWINLTPLYKLRTSRFFDQTAIGSNAISLPSRGAAFSGDVFASALDQSSSISPEQVFANASHEPFAIRHICLDVESRTLLLAGQRHLCLLSFCRSESAFEIPVLDIYLHYEEDQAVEPSVGTGDETSSLMSSSSGRRTNQQGLANSTSHSNSPGQFTGERVRSIRVRQWAPGYQPSLVCRIAVPNFVSSPTELGDAPYPTNFSPISAIALTSATNLLAFATDGGISVVDYYQGICLVCAAIPELEAMDPLRSSRSKSSPRFSSSGNGTKSTQALNVASLASNTANQPPPPSIQPRPSIFRKRSDFPSKTTPPATNHHSFRLPWKRRATKSNAFKRKGHFIEKQTLETLNEERENGLIDQCSQPNVIPQLSHRRIKRHNLHESIPELPSPELTSLQIIDFRGTDKVKPRVISEPPPNTIATSSPLLASSNVSLPLKTCLLISINEMLGAQSSQYDSPPNKSTQEVLISMGSSEISGGTPSRLTALSRGSTRTDLKRTKSQDKYGDSTSQRHSDTSEQSSIDQSVLEGIRTLAFVDMSEQKDEPSLWLGTNRGSVFGFSLDTSDESGTQGPHYNLLGEMCPPPSVKWDAGNSAVPRLTLVPNPDELIGASAEHNPHNYAGSEANAMKRLGGVSHPLPSPANSYRGGGKWKGSGASGSSLTPIANSQEEAPTGSAQESDRYFMVVISEKHAQVIGFPSRNCHNRVKITETSTVVRAEISNQRVPLSMTQTSPFSTLLYVNCLLSNGHLIAFSLPSLRILSDVDAVTGGSIQQSLFTFGNLGHAVYFASPSELAKITLSADLRLVPVLFKVAFLEIFDLFSYYN
ncbi:unnamed protein product [Hymenolepis diminuta]|uniref:Anaphase-promoting complex subunit 1 n=1 Tax=Hymenolepis diminuta TaxID=6216 RepID=A0A158QDD8_HYMDI|nr:unnamed protein product [Hymenolepis diminuta]